MANLLETIQKNRQQVLGQQAPVTDETQRIRELLRAKSGKAASSSASNISNIGEQAAVDQTNQQLASLIPQATIQSQQENVAAAGQMQQQKQQKQEISQARNFNNVQNNIRTQQLLSSLERDKGELDLDRDRAKLEQTSFLLAMQDKQYTDQLEAIGKRRRLDNAQVFASEMQDLAFGQYLGLLQDKLNKNDILAASDREFAEMMNNLSIQDAIKIAEIENKNAQNESDFNINQYQTQYAAASKAASEQAKAQATGQLVTTGVEAYGKYSDSQAKSDYYNTGAGKSDTSYEASKYRK